MYTADGLEHSPSGTPSSLAADHAAQLDKRAAKIAGFNFGPDWGEVSGTGPTCLVTWGSATGPCREAADRLTRAGHPTRVIALRLIAPLARQALDEALTGAATILVVEQNHGAQLFGYLHAQQALPGHARAFARPGPLPLRPAEIVAALRPTEA
jgi:2-oxoglutarate ferredoxin oxidoreductase subunit alpha